MKNIRNHLLLIIDWNDFKIGELIIDWSNFRHSYESVN